MASDFHTFFFFSDFIPITTL